MFHLFAVNPRFKGRLYEVVWATCGIHETRCQVESPQHAIGLRPSHIWWFIVYMIYHCLSMFIMFHHRISLQHGHFCSIPHGQTKPSLVEFTVPRCHLFQASPKRTLWLWLRGNSSGRSSHWVQQPVISYDLGTTKIVINYSINWIGPPLFINWNKLGGLLDPCWIFICMSSPVSKHPKMTQRWSNV